MKFITTSRRLIYYRYDNLKKFPYSFLIFFFSKMKNAHTVDVGEPTLAIKQMAIVLILLEVILNRQFT